ncbi:MAG: L,D-transpeptidase family protein [Pseudomonadota bacterium]
MKKDVIARDLGGPLSPGSRRRQRPVLVRPRPLCRHHALVNGPRGTLIAAIGAPGIVTQKREGDGATPRARLTPKAHFLRTRRPSALPSRIIHPADGWCDAPTSPRYNRWIKHPFPASAEHLWREDGLYDHILITDHNQRPRVRGAGSAIFIHVARPAMTPTAGCLAFSARDWRLARVPMGPYLVGVDQRPERTRVALSKNERPWQRFRRRRRPRWRQPS